MYHYCDLILQYSIQDDTAKDDDMQSVVVSRLDKTFERSEKLKNEPGVTLITVSMHK